jgi:septal ring factor EnvC (AmiA/AmiB activator)
MRWASPLLLLPLLAAASAPVEPQGDPLDVQLKHARSEQAGAEADAARLEQLARHARGQVERLRAEQAASAQALEAAEARITAADARLRLASAYVAAHRQQLAHQQQPLSSLLAGLAMMAQRPPLLAIADRQTSVDELVRVRILLDSTLPVIRARTAKLSSEIGEGNRLEQAALAARAEIVRSRQNLVVRRRQFAALEQKAAEMAARTGTQALSAGDAAITANENFEALTTGEAGSRSAAALAGQLASAGAAPARPFAGEGGMTQPPFDYALPATGTVTEGLGSVNAGGVRSRGIILATVRGVPVTAPASGTVRFSGPFRDYDGVLIIDHGRGWMSLVVNVASELKPGDRVRLGQSVGRALGPLEVELSQFGRRISPALIAGSSQNLSKPGKGG